jgi:hypothetical protein
MNRVKYCEPEDGKHPVTGLPMIGGRGGYSVINDSFWLKQVMAACWRSSNYNCLAGRLSAGPIL